MARGLNAPKVAICGRPNVGKSTLFNRLIGQKKALVLDKPGVTRDVRKERVEWDGVALELADLAGLEPGTASGRGMKDSRRDAELAKLGSEAALAYLRESDLALFVVDARSPLMPDDETLARVVRAAAKPVLLVLSKVEGQIEEQAQSEAARLGWGRGLATSAEHNLGISALRDAILEFLPGARPVSEPGPGPSISDQRSPVIGLTSGRPIRMGVYGRPNVGKSTFVNQLLGIRRMITSPIAGTTVDTVDTDFSREGRHYRILDTAGIRRKGKTERGVEVLSVVQALKSLEGVDVALFLIDGFEGVTDQDEKIAGALARAGRPVVLIVNKWDLCREKEEKYAERARGALGFLDFAPILFVSAERGEGIDPLWRLLDEILRQRRIVAPTAELNRFLEQVEGTNNPTGVRLYYATQTSKNPPTITCLVSDPKKVHFAYERFLRNELRNRYGWMGSPVRLVFKARKRSPSKKGRD